MLGSIIRPLSSWKVHLRSALYYPVLGGQSFYYRNALHQHLTITRHLGLRLELNHFKAAIEGLVALQIYF
jgi:hypothetical protein